jgi:hypothetical protein
VLEGWGWCLGWPGSAHPETLGQLSKPGVLTSSMHPKPTLSPVHALLLSLGSIMSAHINTTAVTLLSAGPPSAGPLAMTDAVSHTSIL